MGIDQRVDENEDQFPVGLRVLAVDDNPTCLLLLETLLKKCQYNVTTTSQAIAALKLLRENKNRFDLVISDVDMPDMDGFKLLELVGLEMDLPVIMLSSHGDTNLVMKGITHGACDYLLKPVRIEELKNIWIHVLKRKKFDSKKQKVSDKLNKVGEGLTGTGDSDLDVKLCRKRKDQNENEDEDNDEDGDNHSEDVSTQKKPRVVWSYDLHQKFLAAVNQLGIDKAVPKRILELMNEERLTRENVASHLQKYRISLRRISHDSIQQAYTVPNSRAAGSYLRTDSLNHFGNAQRNPISCQLLTAGLGPSSASSILNKLNSRAIQGMCGVSSSGTIQLGCSQNPFNSINGITNHLNMQPGNKYVNILEGKPISLGIDQLKHCKDNAQIGEFSAENLDPHSSGLFGIKVGIENSNFSISNSYQLSRQNQPAQRERVFGDPSSAKLASVSSESSSRFHEFGRCGDDFPSSIAQPNSFVESVSFQRAASHDLENNMSSLAVHKVVNTSDVFPSSSVVKQQSYNLMDCQVPLIYGGCPKAITSSTGHASHNIEQVSAHQSNMVHVPISSSIHLDGFAGPFSHRLDLKNFSANNDDGFSFFVQMNCGDSLSGPHDGVDQMITQVKQEYMGNQRSSLGQYENNSVGSLEDLVSMMLKKDQETL